MPECTYKGINRKFLIEEVLLEDTSNLAADYKFRMINGKCHIVNVI